MRRLLHLFLPLALMAVLAACSSGLPAKWMDSLDTPLWKGEMVGIRAAVFVPDGARGMTVGVEGVPFVQASFLTAVKGDVLDEKYDQCGKHTLSDCDSILVFDRIGNESKLDVTPGDTQYVWLSIRVPEQCMAGKYTGRMVIRGEGIRTTRLPFSFSVSHKALPSSSAWTFHLDLWQNPCSGARCYGVEPWSEAHFNYMRPIMSLLAQAGQKVVTATIIEKPWNAQTHDPFASMIVKKRSPDGQWSYDYSVFDRWVEFMEELGIDKQINCYTMIPWKLTFDYLDEASGQVCYLKAAPGSREYEEYWNSFLKDFAAHLRSKGWFPKTRIAMDERPLDAMTACLKVIRHAVPDFGVALAGNYHEELQADIADLCIRSSELFPAEILKGRRAGKQVSTYYTSCSEKYPNTFLASDSREATWLAWYALAGDFDGYLRWAYNSWTENPVSDARFRTWPAGDCFFVYPDGCSSVRFERLLEGIQDYEKVKILSAEWESMGNVQKLDLRDRVLNQFSIPNLAAEGPEQAISAARKALFSEPD